MATYAASTALVPGRYNVWLPTGRVKNRYLSFDTAAEAKAAVTARGTGVVLGPKGQLDPTHQPWSGWTQFQAKAAALPGVTLMTPAHPHAAPAHAPLSHDAKSHPTHGEFNVWVPPSYLGSVTPPLTASAHPNGAYFAFHTEAQARAKATSLGNLGVVVDRHGVASLTQVWSQASSFVSSASQAALTPHHTNGTFAVWLPDQWLQYLGFQVPALSGCGGFLPFDSLADARAKVMAWGAGVVLDKDGTPDAAQPWASASSLSTVLLNAQLKPKRVAYQFNVWFPSASLGSIGVTAPAAFPHGAYLPFKTEAEAAAHVTARGGYGVVLDHHGSPTATQPWGQAASAALGLLDDELSATRPAGQFSVWFPASTVGYLGLSNPGPLAQGAYLSFKTEAAAQAHVAARSFGVVLGPKGAPAATQSWYQAGQAITQLTNHLLKPSLVPGHFNVWFPAQVYSSLGALSRTISAAPGGAYLAFKTEAEAVAHVTARGCGVVLDGEGTLTASQPWSSGPQLAAQRLNDQLKPRRVAHQFNVWFPGQYVGSLGVANVAPFGTGAYLAFKTEAAAQAHVTARGFGVVLDAKGDAAATQSWYQAAQFLAQLTNAQLTARATAGKFNLWIPSQYLPQAGVAATGFPSGGYLAFDTEAAAQAQAQARGLGVVLDKKGHPAATQSWAYATQMSAQLLNDRAVAALPKHAFSVWLPPTMLASAGFSDVSKFPQGAYLEFATEAEATAHVNQRTFGVLVDDRGRAAALQPWAQAVSYIPTNTELKPAPPSGWVSGGKPVGAATAARLGTPTAGSVALGAIKPTKKGADVVAYVATTYGSDSVHFFLGGQLNGNWTPTFSVPDLVPLTGPGWSQFTLHLDYAQVDAYLKSVNPSLGVTPDMPSAIGITFVTGHNTGLPGWSSNSGTEKDAMFNLPAKT